MGYRKEDIPGIIAALKDARALIRGGIKSYVCSALTATGIDYENRARRMVAQSLGRHFTLEGYLGRRVRRETRLRWIDKMIADLKEYAK